MINRRTPSIIVPINSKCMESLFRQDYDEIMSYNFKFETLSIPRETDLQLLFEINLFQELNRKFKKNIEEYEEEYFYYEELDSLRIWLNNWILNIKIEPVTQFYLKKLTKLIELALDQKSCLAIWF